eukprot:Hpha_TRINITY_DN1818_c0_g1::TRINITY_DN1818_c0_g1_i1::g.170712::m.170712
MRVGILALFQVAAAWNAEYPGFAHFRLWNGTIDGIGNSACTPTELGSVMPNGQQYPVDLGLSVCNAMDGCFSVGNLVNGGLGDFRKPAGTDYDMYLANDTNIVPAAVCSTYTPRCGPSECWVTCQLDFFDTPIATFVLPPDTIHTSCIQNPDCLAFSVKNDGSSGTLYKYNWKRPGFFRIW